ncbi:aldose 1-epimerase family protein [Cnuibacter physcomitrellae]|uniref:aldose 1-epimerase family protein n=1 Tax=Cnuibacter physcomitrellae TaxID=1619308 RepID=UPI00217604B9|nr:aldose 1-epimerase family protein [Cnuibacter physcomitrellae]MCS5497964.1 aldose 1-epimerase family protein [Cnuibacter physcomitrellae]
MSTAPRPVSGTQHRLESHGYALDIASIGATVRRVTHEGRDLVVAFEADELRPAYRGAVLAPWPNRVVDGRYTWEGAELQLPLTEPSRGHALHGLASWLDFSATEVSPDAITLSATVEPQAGYPFRVEVVVEYRLDADGLRTTVTGTNVGEGVAPFGTGPHPYLVAGDSPLDEWTLSLPAETVLEVTPDRLIPTDLAPVTTAEGGAFDFRTPRTIGATEIDHAFTDLVRDASGATTVSVTDADGRGVAMTWGADCGWVQIHTADLLPSQGVTRLGLAVEPMTCPPDAFNSGTDVLRLGPGESASASWRLHALG